MARPSIADLEAILQREDEVEIEILPNGEVRAKNETTSAERGGRKPLVIDYFCSASLAIWLCSCASSCDLAARSLNV